MNVTAHHITNVEVQETWHYESQFVTKKIIATDRDGNQIEFCMFGAMPSDLKFNVKEIRKVD